MLGYIIDTGARLPRSELSEHWGLCNLACTLNYV